MESEFNPAPAQISKIYLANGSVYVGEQRNGSREGSGKTTYVDGSFYDGEWANDQKHGNGQYQYLD